MNAVIAKLREFVAAYKGKARYSACTGNQGVYSPQCVDGVEIWAAKIGAACFGRGGNARAILANLKGQPGWRVVGYRKGRIPPPGAVVVLAHHKTGHTMTALEGCTATTMRTFDENWSWPGHFTIETHDYSECMGWAIYEPAYATPKPKPDARRYRLVNADGHQHDHGVTEAEMVAWMRAKRGNQSERTK